MALSQSFSSRLALVIAALSATTLLSCGGCQDGAKSSGEMRTSSSTSWTSGSSIQVSGDEPITQASAQRYRQGGSSTANPRSGAGSPSTTAAQPSLGAANGDAAAGPSSVWAVLMKSLSTPGHREQAHQIRQLFVTAAPELQSGIWVHTDAEGSAVLYGQFRDPEDPAAQSALRVVKGVNVGGRTPFAYSHLAKIDLSSGAEPIHQYDIRSLRRQHPKVDPLYTLDVACWLAPEGDERSWREAQRLSQAYAESLRAQGHEAWFYHNHDQMVSSVTVGKFDRTSIDRTSGLFSLDVRRLMETFPKRLVNGEELLVRKNPRDPESEMIPQTPQLVEVPKRLD